MATNYKINNVDIDSIYETFTTSVAQQYGVTDSKFTDSTAKFKKNRQPLKTAIGKTFPTSAGTHLGGSNTCTQYKVNGQPINVALKGCRPIGIPLATLSVGTHYINRVNGETWLSTSANSATGTRLDYNPKFIFVELQGGGGGGASAFANGSNGDRREKPSSPGIQGSGGAGAGFHEGRANPGIEGGDGLAIIYY